MTPWAEGDWAKRGEGTARIMWRFEEFTRRWGLSGAVPDEGQDIETKKTLSQLLTFAHLFSQAQFYQKLFGLTRALTAQYAK